MATTQYQDQSITDLLRQAADGRIGVDQRLLHGIVDRPNAAEEVLQFGLLASQEDPVDIRSTLIDILRYLRHPSAVPFYVKLMSEDPDGLGDETLEAVAELGAPALEPLLASLEATPSARAPIVFMLAAIGVKDPRIQGAIEEALKEDPWDAAITVGLYGDPALKPAAQTALDSLDPKDKDAEGTRAALESALEQLEKPALREPVAPFDIWALYPERSTPDFDSIDPEDRLEFLDDSDPLNREAAALALEHDVLDEEEEPNEEIVEALLEHARNDPDPKVRGACWQALGPATEDTEVLAALREKALDQAAPLEERAGAVVALSEEAGAPRMRPIVEEIYRNPETRPLALRAMWRSYDRGFADFVVKHVEDPNRLVQIEAIFGVGTLGLVSEIGRLEKLMEDPDVREHALFSYASACPGDATRAGVQSILKKVDRISGGLSDDEEDIVKAALDQRLMRKGKNPVFFEME